MKLLRPWLAVLGLMMCPGLPVAQTVVHAGAVAGTWDTDGSPYLVQGNIKVPLDSQLVIHPGTEILFMGAFQLSVYGNLDASGTATDSIYFSTPDSIPDWSGVRLIDIVQIFPDSVRFAYCRFSRSRKDHPDSLGGAIFARNSPRVSIRNCLFTGCYAGSGGALYLKNSSLLVKSSAFNANQAARGGAMYVHQSAPDLVNLEITGNTGDVGGGVYFYNSNALLAYSDISSNTSLGGGGGIILHKASNATILHCAISFNTAYGSGGGIALLEGSMPYISFCQITHNQTVQDQYVSKGGGIFITQYGNNPLIENTEISYNTSADDGGGIYTESLLSLVSSLVVHNEANISQGFGGGGIHAVYGRSLILNCTFSSNKATQGTAAYATGADLEIYNSIVWDDDQSVLKKIYMRNFLLDPTLKIDHSDLEGGEEQIGNTGTYQLVWGDFNINEDPLFIDPSSGAYSLDLGSPCIDMGLLDTLAFLLPSIDMAMNPRVVGGYVDIGCFENQDATGFSDQIDRDEAILQVFPVPAKDHINIKISDQLTGKQYIIDILSISGNLLLRKQIDSHAHMVRIGLGSLPAGTYLLRMQGIKVQESVMFNIIR